MTAQDCIGCKQRPDLDKQLSTEQLPLHCQSPTLIVTKQDAFLSQLLAKHLVLRAQVIDDLSLLAVDPARKNKQIELPWLGAKSH